MVQDLKKIHPLPKSVKQGPVSIECPGYPKVEGETIPRRNAKCKDGVQSRPHKDIATMHDILKYASATYGNAQCTGVRRQLHTHTETKKVKKVVDGKTEESDKKWTYFELSGYSYLTFIEFEKLCLDLGAGLRKLGLEKPDKIHLFAATHQNWLAMAQGAFSQSMTIVTAYENLGEAGLTHSLVQTGPKAIYLDPGLLPRLINPLKTAEGVKFIIYNNDPGVQQADVDKLKAEHPELQILNIDDLRKLGAENPIDTVPPAAEDLAGIMYTSGSMGTPKGVVIKHKNIVAAVAGVNVSVGAYLGPGDTFLAFLPLAHILEVVMEHAVLFWGGTLGYGNPRTLSDASVRNCKGDILELRPTVLVGVPAVYETVKKGVIAKINAGSPMVKALFWSALSAKNFLLSSGLPGTGILDAVVFNKVREATGGRLRVCMTGGGPISIETHRFISMAIAPLVHGYGLTETSATGVLQDPLAWTSSALGEMTGCIEMKLVDFAEAGYFAKNNPPQGEIWIRGESITGGYLDLEGETKEAYTADGWFRTGDIGEFDSKGQLRIIDRMKNLVKTLNGEYVALEKLESIYRSATVVGNICIVAQADKAKPVAIIAPVEPALKKLASENGIKGDTLEELAHDGKLKEIVLKELQAQGKKGGLLPFEIIDGVVLSDEEWTPQNGLLTAAQKLSRKAILDKHKKDVEKAHASSS